jgi:hypothetical protein
MDTVPYMRFIYDFVNNNNNNNNNNEINKKEKTCMLIDVTKSAGRNIMQKRSRKEAKIQEFYVERYNYCGTRNV